MPLPPEWEEKTTLKNNDLALTTESLRVKKASEKREKELEMKECKGIGEVEGRKREMKREYD